MAGDQKEKDELRAIIKNLEEKLKGKTLNICYNGFKQINMSLAYGILIFLIWHPLFFKWIAANKAEKPFEDFSAQIGDQDSVQPQDR